MPKSIDIIYSINNIEFFKFIQFNSIQSIIGKHPSWTKKDFRGEGKQNPKKENALLSRKETERPGLKFGHYGKRKASIKEIYKHSTYESIKEYENKQIDENTFRNRARTKKQRDLSI